MTLALALRINLAGLTAAHLFSAGGVGGAAVTYRILQKRGMRHATVLIAVIFQNAFAYGVLVRALRRRPPRGLLRGGANDFAVVFAAAFILLIAAGAAYGFWLLSHPTALRQQARRAVSTRSRARAAASAIPVSELDEWIDGVVDGWRRLRGRRPPPPAHAGAAPPPTGPSTSCAWCW